MRVHPAYIRELAGISHDIGAVVLQGALRYPQRKVLQKGAPATPE